MNQFDDLSGEPRRFRTALRSKANDVGRARGRVKLLTCFQERKQPFHVGELGTEEEIAESAEDHQGSLRSLKSLLVVHQRSTAADDRRLEAAHRVAMQLNRLE